MSARALVTVALVAFTTSAVLQVFVARSYRRSTSALLTELALVRQVNARLMTRVAALAPCEVCGRPLAEGDTATVRLGPDGYDVVAHGLCLGPLPGQAPGY